MSSADAAARAGERARRWGALCWLATLPYFAVELVVAAEARPSHSFLEDTISELGISECVTMPGATSTVCSSLHDLMNTTFVVLGLLTSIGAILLRSRWPRGRTTTTGLVLVVVAGLSTTATGLVPVNVSVTAHAIAALPQFVLQNAGMLLLGTAAWRTDRVIALSATLSAALGLLGLALFILAFPLGLPQGLLERLTLYPLTVWTTVVALVVLRHPRTSTVPRTPSVSR